MESVSHRELRNNSGEVLRRVQAGESIEVTNYGVTAAVLVPPPRSALDRLEASGDLSRATGDPADLLAIELVPADELISTVLEDLKGDR